MAIGFPVKDDYVTGDVLTAANMNDLSGSVNLLESAQYAAGKNKMLNGDFSVNQRNFTSTTTHNAYTFDRFQCKATDGTTTLTAQTFTLGTAPVTGYEATNYLDIASTGQTLSSARSGVAAVMEGVRTFANQTVTVSFYAKAASGTPSVAYYLVQDFGTGGSPSTAVNINGNKTAITTSWARYSFTVAVPSIAGKTFGTNKNSSFSLLIYGSAGSNYDTLTNSLGIQTTTISIWGVQVEASLTASDFATATGTIQGELAACQRYYYRIYTGSAYRPYGVGQNFSTTQSLVDTRLPVTMRTRPTALEQSGTAADYGVLNANATNNTCNAVPIFDNSTTDAVITRFTVGSGLVAGNATFGTAGNVATSFLGWSAEL
jgi:hypothetical protein